MEDTEIIRQFYDASVETEWARLERHRAEFAITGHYIDQYVRPGDRVLDIGGGPGRYSLRLAGRGCRVTLLDLSDENVRFARAKAKESGQALTALQGDACRADRLLPGERFDCVLLMGPMYHLLEEERRIQAVQAALRLLRPGGVIFVSFISLYAGFLYYMANGPELLMAESEKEYIRCYLENRTYCGDAFTKACFTAPRDILPFMAQFPLKKLHLFGQEGILSPCEARVYACGDAAAQRWIDIALRTCEREEFLAYSEHLMYVGRLEGRKTPAAAGEPERGKSSC